MTTAPATPLSLITVADPGSPASEAYRTLRTNIHFASLDNPLKALLITSTDPGEGKSTTLANLAVTMAQAGNRVLVVDCDLRRPSLHRLFGLSNAAGLTTMMLEAHAKEQPPVQASSVPGLSVLTSGPLPPNPSELLGSRRMADVLAQLRNEADIVLVDAPPIIAVSDAAILASKVDGVLLVVQANKTRRDLARKAKAALDKANANLLGVVLNNVKMDANMYRYYAEPAAGVPASDRGAPLFRHRRRRRQPAGQGHHRGHPAADPRRGHLPGQPRPHRTGGRARCGGRHRHPARRGPAGRPVRLDPRHRSHLPSRRRRRAHLPGHLRDPGRRQHPAALARRIRGGRRLLETGRRMQVRQIAGTIVVDTANPNLLIETAATIAALRPGSFRIVAQGNDATVTVYRGTVAGRTGDTEVPIGEGEEVRLSAGQAQSTRWERPAAPTPVPVPTRAPTPTPMPTVGPAQRTHIVEQGDTLLYLAAKYRTTVEAIQRLNNIADPHSLSIGQKLLIPPAAPAQ